MAASAARPVGPADPVQVTSVEFSDWGEGIANSEMAEECAFALMSRSPRGDEWGRAWCDTGNELLGYAGLLALSRLPHVDGCGYCRKSNPRLATCQRIAGAGRCLSAYLSMFVQSLYSRCGNRLYCGQGLQAAAA